MISRPTNSTVPIQRTPEQSNLLAPHLHALNAIANAIHENISSGAITAQQGASKLQAASNNYAKHYAAIHNGIPPIGNKNIAGASTTKNGNNVFDSSGGQGSVFDASGGQGSMTTYDYGQGGTSIPKPNTPPAKSSITSASIGNRTITTPNGGTVVVNKNGRIVGTFNS